MKNRIEKGKGQLKELGIILLVISLLALVGGIVMITLSLKDGVKVAMLVIGIILTIISIPGFIIGVMFTWTSTALKATKGSLAEDNLGMGTANMHKCSNCGAEIPAERTICEKCEENLKP